MSERTRNSQRGMDPEFEVQLGHVCNNRCNFCVSGQLTEQRRAGIIPLEQILAVLDQAHADGFTKATFLGGEPTLFKTFLPSLQRAVDLGFEEIVIFTNGVKARNPKWLRTVVSMGTFTWRFSIQGGTEEAHDKVTGRKGSFARIVQGMQHLQRVGGQRVTMNMCVNEDSYRSLPSLPEVCAEYGVIQACIDMVRPSSTGERSDAYLAQIMTPYGDMAPAIDQMLQQFEVLAPNCEVNLTNYPFCHLPQWAHVMTHGGESTTTFTADQTDDDGEVAHHAFDKYAFQTSDRVHGPGCSACVFRPGCAGVAGKYVELFGLEDLAPVSRGQLEAIDLGKNRLFPLLAQTLVEPLADGTPPAGWELIRIKGNNRDRRIDVRFEHPLGAVYATVSPPGSVGLNLDPWPPIVRTERFEVRLLPTPGSDSAPIAELAGYIQAMLGESGGDRSSSDRESRQRQGRSRVGSLFARLQAPGVLSWPIAEARQVSPDQATIRFDVVEGGWVEVGLQVNPEASGPRVQVSFDFGGLNEPKARDVVRRISRFLRHSDQAFRRSRAGRLTAAVPAG